MQPSVMLSQRHQEPLLLTVAEAVELTRISRTKFYELVKSGEVPSVSIDRSRRIPLDGLKDWIKGQTQGASLRMATGSF